MKKNTLLFCLVFLLACKDNLPPVTPPVVSETHLFLKAADLSDLKKIEDAGIVFKNASGQAEDLMTTLASEGCNAIRLRLWKNPADEHASYEEVKAVAQRIKSHNMKLWLSVHYSDTWADPGQQTTPSAWANLTLTQLKDSVYNYTKAIVTEMQPDYIQIGNEINGGLLWPKGSINNPDQFLALLTVGIQAVRDNAPNTQIIVHYAGIDAADWFFGQLTGLDYDIIGLSYYPVWHGKNLDLLSTTIQDLGAVYDKDVVIAETAYPFTLDWNDWTNNVVGETSQLILPEYPATETGQKAFLNNLVDISKATNRGIGFCYWGGELVAYNGTQSTNGSSFENQAMYNFQYQALPIMQVFGR